MLHDAANDFTSVHMLYYSVSRAFVSESDSQFQDEEAPEIKIPLPPEAANYMTPAGAQALRAELGALRGGQRPRVAGAVTRLAASGSFSDRDELAVQRKRLREIDRRIEYLSRMLARLEVIDPAAQAGQRVLFGARVSVQAEDGSRRVYRIVGVDEADPAAGAVSWIAPLARALLGRSPGEWVDLKLPEGEQKLRILAVEYS
jgi:transcription elongation factor GreB